MSTAISDIDEALYNVVVEDKLLSAILKGRKLYVSRPDPGSKIPYITLGSPNERDRSTFSGGRGNVGQERLHIWAESRKQALEIYQHLQRLLHAQILSLDNNNMLRGELSFSVLMNDPDDSEIIHAALMFDYVTKAK